LCPTHTAETLNNLSDYLEEFHPNNVIFTTCQMPKTTDSIANECGNDLMRQPMAADAIEDEDRPEWVHAVSCPQKENQQAADRQDLEEVNNST
jgi:hypothetical protein